MQEREEPLQFTTGDVLSRSAAIAARNFLPFGVLALICFSPILVYSYSVLSDPFESNLNRWELLVFFGSILCGNMLKGLVVYGVFCQLRGRPASFGTCLKMGLTRLFPVVGVTVVACLAIGLGLIALVVPGVVILCRLWVAVPAAVVEKTGVLKSLTRSEQLTSGLRWSVFGVVAILYVGQKIIAEVLLRGISGSATLGELTVWLWAVVVLAILIALIRAVAAAVSYHDLRVVKDGADVEELAAVFE